MYIILFGYSLECHSEFGSFDFGECHSLSDVDLEYIEWCEKHHSHKP